MDVQGHSVRRAAIALALAVIGVGVCYGSAAAQAKKPPAKPKAEAPKSPEYEGWRQYMTNCARCHGDDALGGVIAPDLRKSVAKGTTDGTAFQTVALQGRLGKGMPAFDRILSKEQVDAIYAYVKARAEDRLPPGRPAS